MANILSDTLQAAIYGLGGPKAVGHMLRPDSEPAEAATWIKHCLDDGRREKLSLNQIELILSHASGLNEHKPFLSFASALGYDSKPKAPEVALLELVARSNHLRTELREIEQAARDIDANPRLRALMRSAGIPVDTL